MLYPTELRALVGHYRRRAGRFNRRAVLFTTGRLTPCPADLLLTVETVEKRRFDDERQSHEE